MSVALGTPPVVTPGKDKAVDLEYGKSITDACIGWDDSAQVLEILSDAVARRRG